MSANQKQKMSNEFSITKADEAIDLGNNKADTFASLTKAVAGAIPGVSFFGEFLTTTIPNQRIDRLVQFAELLEQKLHYLQDDVIQQKLKSEEFSELAYETLSQASKTNSKDRREYLASLLKNSLSDEELELMEKEKLLELLGQLNDTEIIFLKYYSLNSPLVKKAFYKLHQSILGDIFPVLGQEQLARNKRALQKNYTDKLVSLGLVELKPHKTMDGQILIDERTGNPKISYIEARQLGDMLLRYIDFQDFDATNTTDNEVIK